MAKLTASDCSLSNVLTSLSFSSSGWCILRTMWILIWEITRKRGKDRSIMKLFMLSPAPQLQWDRKSTTTGMMIWPRNSWKVKSWDYKNQLQFKSLFFLNIHTKLQSKFSKLNWRELENKLFIGGLCYKRFLCNLLRNSDYLMLKECWCYYTMCRIT